jgi:hypothetical protein
MDELLSLLLQCFLWYMLFKIIFAFIEAWGRHKIIDEHRKELVKHISNIVHYVEQEKHNECYYWFDKQTDEFLAQGQTDEEIKQHLAARFKGHIFVLDDDRALFGPELKTVPVDQLPRLFNENTNAS